MQEVFGAGTMSIGTKLDESTWYRQMDTKEYGKMLRWILILEEERVPAKHARGWKNGG